MARIEKKFGLKADLVEGHDGIYEVRLNGRIVHSNQRACGSMIPSDRILQEITKYRPLLPGEELQDILPLFPGVYEEKDI